MFEETPSRMTVGYRILNDNDEEIDLSPVILRSGINTESYSRKLSFRNSQIPAEHDSSYMHLDLSDEPTVLNGLNYLNVGAYLAHVIVSLGIGAWGIDGIMSTHWEITKTYQALLTPPKWAYSVWIPIMVCEGIFSGAQLLRDFRSRPIVQDGTGYWFFYTCLLQMGWVLFFSFRLVIPACVFVVGVFLSLAMLLMKQHSSISHSSWDEYWLFRFPFSLHCGWMAVMVIVDASVLCRHFALSLGIQLAAAMVALALMLPWANFVMWSVDYMSTDFIIPSTIVWAYIGIAWSLRHPSETLLNDYGETVIEAVRLSSYSFAFIVFALMVPQALVWAGRRFCTIQVVTMQEDSYTTE